MVGTRRMRVIVDGLVVTTPLAPEAAATAAGFAFGDETSNVNPSAEIGDATNPAESVLIAERERISMFGTGRELPREAKG